jgi:hypothetical protein
MATIIVCRSDTSLGIEFFGLGQFESVQEDLQSGGRYLSLNYQFCHELWLLRCFQYEMKNPLLP